MAETDGPEWEEVPQMLRQERTDGTIGGDESLSGTVEAIDWGVSEGASDPMTAQVGLKREHADVLSGMPPVRVRLTDQ